MNTEIGHGLLPLAPILIIGLFFGFYKLIWKATTGEPWTNILRRNDRLSIPIIVVAIATLGVVTWGVPWWLAWLPVFLTFVAVLWAHVDWAGLRWGAIHRPTAWRCVEELKGYSPLAADWLEQQLVAKGHPYERSDRTGEQRGLPTQPSPGSPA